MRVIAGVLPLQPVRAHELTHEGVVPAGRAFLLALDSDLAVVRCKTVLEAAELLGFDKPDPIDGWEWAAVSRHDGRAEKLLAALLFGTTRHLDAGVSVLDTWPNQFHLDA